MIDNGIPTFENVNCPFCNNTVVVTTSGIPKTSKIPIRPRLVSNIFSKFIQEVKKYKQYQQNMDS